MGRKRSCTRGNHLTSRPITTRPPHRERWPFHTQCHTTNIIDLGSKYAARTVDWVRLPPDGGIPLIVTHRSNALNLPQPTYIWGGVRMGRARHLIEHRVATISERFTPRKRAAPHSERVAPLPAHTFDNRARTICAHLRAQCSSAHCRRLAFKLFDLRVAFQKLWW